MPPNRYEQAIAEATTSRVRQLAREGVPVDLGAPIERSCAICHGRGEVQRKGRVVDACPACAAKAEIEYREAKT